MKKFLSAPIILSGLVLSAFSLLGSEPIKAKDRVIDNYGDCKLVKTSKGKFNVIIRSNNVKVHSGTDKRALRNRMYQDKRNCG